MLLLSCHYYHQRLPTNQSFSSFPTDVGVGVGVDIDIDIDINININININIDIDETTHIIHWYRWYELHYCTLHNYYPHSSDDTSDMVAVDATTVRELLP